MFGDLPRGHHKNNSMHKLASKTMIEILPDNLAAYVEKKCGSLAGKFPSSLIIAGILRDKTIYKKLMNKITPSVYQNYRLNYLTTTSLESKFNRSI